MSSNSPSRRTAAAAAGRRKSRSSNSSNKRTIAIVLVTLALVSGPVQVLWSLRLHNNSDNDQRQPQQEYDAAAVLESSLSLSSSSSLSRQKIDAPTAISARQANETKQSQEPQQQEERTKPLLLLSSSAPTANELERYLQSTLDIVGRSDDANTTTTTTTTTMTPLLHNQFLLANYTGELKQLWTCDYKPAISRNSNQNKSSDTSSTTTAAAQQQQIPASKLFVFVHIFKTAGSTFRRYLSLYGALCGKGVTVLSKCSYVSHESLTAGPDSIWRSPDGSACINQRTFPRHMDLGDGAVHVEGKMNGAIMAQYGVDILAGHLPIGMHKYYQAAWSEPTMTTSTANNIATSQANTTATASTIPVQYMTFIRDPIAKYVSGRLFVHRYDNWNISDAVAEIQQRVTYEMTKAKPSYYNAYYKYLSTPQQKQSLKKLSYDEQVDLMQRNLLKYNVMVGVVERMKDSLQLLQSIVDGTRKTTAFLQAVDDNHDRSASKAKRKNKAATTIKVNQSKLSTSQIVRVLQEQDPAFMDLMRQHLKYEFRFYEFAWRVHQKQVAHLHAVYGNMFDYTVDGDE